jgi:hypothetical protein
MPDETFRLCACGNSFPVNPKEKRRRELCDACRIENNRRLNRKNFHLRKGRQAHDPMLHLGMDYVHAKMDGWLVSQALVEA